jgi:hypothetical protein
MLVVTETGRRCSRAAPIRCAADTSSRNAAASSGWRSTPTARTAETGRARRSRTASTTTSWSGRASATGSPTKRTPPVRVLDMAEMPSTEPPAEPLLVGGNVTMVAGREGQGKSMLALALAAAIGDGATVAGIGCAPGRVLYIDAENGPGEIHRRVHGLGVRPGTLVYAEANGFDLRTDFAEIEALVAQHQPSVLMLDSLRSLAPGLDENDSKTPRPRCALSRGSRSAWGSRRSSCTTPGRRPRVPRQHRDRLGGRARVHAVAPRRRPREAHAAQAGVLEVPARGGASRAVDLARRQRGQPDPARRSGAVRARAWDTGSRRARLRAARMVPRCHGARGVGTLAPSVDARRSLPRGWPWTEGRHGPPRGRPARGPGHPLPRRRQPLVCARRVLPHERQRERGCVVSAPVSPPTSSRRSRGG